MTKDERLKTKAKLKVVGICGSLRKDSFNKKLLNLIFKSLSSKGIEVEELFWEDFVAYNEDVQNAGMPANVEAFKEKIAQADGIVFASPEYNFSLPGGLKNAIDWASRPDADLERVFGGNKVALVGGVSSGIRGTARMQMIMPSICQDLGLVLCPAQILVASGAEAFDEGGNLIKENTAKQTQKAIDKFTELLGKLRG